MFFGCFAFRAAEFIHSRNIVHLDLKPQNIVLVESPRRRSSAGASTSGGVRPKSTSDAPATSVDGCGANDDTEGGGGGGNGNGGVGEKLKIIDFGLARDLGEADRMAINMCGTLEFMSPEVMR